MNTLERVPRQRTGPPRAGSQPMTYRAISYPPPGLVAPRVDPPSSLGRMALAAGVGAMILAAGYLYRDPAAAQGSQDILSWAATWLLNSG